MDLQQFENRFLEKILQVATSDDPAHDVLHFQRVVSLAKKLGEREGGKIEIILPAAWLHDLVIVPKDHPQRHQASQLSAQAAVKFLAEIQYPEKYLAEIAHAIESHSFSANIEAKTIEAKIVQDADRLDGLGAIGIARCFATAGLLKRAFYNPQDPFCEQRDPDDSRFTVDHFYRKLFQVAESLKTPSGREEGQRRVATMKQYLLKLREEVNPALNQL